MAHDFAWVKDWGVLVVSALTLLSTTFQFYLRDFWAPRRKPSALEIKAELQEAGRRDGMALVRLVLRATNTTDRRIYVPAFWLAVHGYGLGDGIRAADTDWRAALDEPSDALSTSFNTPVDITLLAQRRIFADGSAWYDPKDVTVFEDVIAVPAGRFDYLKLAVNYVQGRSLDALNEAEPVVWFEDQGSWYAVPWFRDMARPTAAPSKAESAETLARGTRWREKAGGGLNVSEIALPLGKPTA
ncbi:MAG: hypothetical protein U1F33_06790 [Alphaproteobacteria bacterium]